MIVICCVKFWLGLSYTCVFCKHDYTCNCIEGNKGGYEVCCACVLLLMCVVCQCCICPACVFGVFVVWLFEIA